MKDDEKLFRSAIAGTRPLGARPVVVARPPSMRSLLRERAIERPQTIEPRKVLAPMPPLSPDKSPGLDRATAETLRRGRLQPDGVLDLHGNTLAEAERLLARTLEQAQLRGWRSLLVVTGKGLRLEDGSVRGGRIRAHFLDWINAPANRLRVHAVRQAHPRHGGSGAFYLLLRRAG